MSSASNNIYSDGSFGCSDATTGSQSGAGITIGDLRGAGAPVATGYGWNGKVLELIIYNFNQSANRATIESDMINYYGL